MISFIPGDIITCHSSNGYLLTINKTYIVDTYEPEERVNAFRFPAYVAVRDDFGELVRCHASRFHIAIADEK